MDVTIERKILLKITMEHPTSGRYWYQHSLYSKTKKDEYWSQFSRAIHELSRQSYLEIGEVDRHGKKPISATFWGLLKALSYFFQKNPIVSEDVLRALTDFFDNTEKELPFLYEIWPFLDIEAKKKIAKRISEYVSDFQELHSRSNLIDDFRSNLIKWQREQRNSKKIIPELEKAMISIAKQQFLAFIFFEPCLNSCAEEALKTEKTEKEKIISLLRNLKQKRKEFHSRSKYLPCFSENVENYSQEKVEDNMTPIEISKFKSMGIKRSVYQAWIALTLILMCEPTEFREMRRGNLQEPKRTISFVRKDNEEKIGWPNFIFFSNNIRAWIGFWFGVSSRLYGEPNIWIRVSREQKNFKQLRDPLILAESEEESGWAESGKGGLLREYEVQNVLDKIPRSKEVDLLKYYVRQHDPSSRLFVVCLENEKGSRQKFRSHRISILEGVNFEEARLKPIIEAVSLLKTWEGNSC